MKTLILFILLYSTSVFAGVRCNGQIIGVGDPEYVVNQACGSPINYHQVGSGSNSSGDEAYAYYKVGNETVEIHFIDGKVYTIGGDENRH